MSTAIKVENVGKNFTLVENRSLDMKAALSNILHLRRSKKKTFWALKEVSFSVEKGEVLGIIGRNGSGKSTLLKIISKITPPTTGRIEIEGKVNTLLEVGTGFHPELTGRENIFLNGTILGMTKIQIENRFAEIVDFAGVVPFIDTPVKHYSSGMYVRLAFAVASHLEPDILIVDEVLSVGDAEFQQKCLDKMEQEVMRGRTVLFVSHDMHAIQRLCHRVILLEDGRLTQTGTPDEVVDYYLETFEKQVTQALLPIGIRRGNGAFRITKILLLNRNGQPVEMLNSGELASFEIHYQTDKPTLNQVNIRLFISTVGGDLLFPCISRVKLAGQPIPGRGIAICTIQKLPLNIGHYRVDLDGYFQGELADVVPHALTFKVMSGDFYPDGLLPASRYKILTDYTWEVRKNE